MMLSLFPARSQPLPAFLPRRAFRYALILLAALGVPPGAALAGGDDWLVSTHTCPGANRTDALHRDDDGTLWVGCGTAATGYGLSMSEDGGATWQDAPVTPTDKLDKFRVNSISRGVDGHLKIAGFEATTKEMVLSLDTAAAPFAVTPVLVGVNQVGRQFHVGTYREKSLGNGFNNAIAESLNGVDMLLRGSGNTSTSAANWFLNQPPSQMLDVVVHDRRFWGCGSSISEPPQLFLPPQDQLASLPFDIAQPTLNNAWEGELWGLAVNDARLVATGVDQDKDIGKILVSGPNPRNMNGYTEHSMSVIYGNPGANTWGRGVCMHGNRVIVVGERQPLGSRTGLVFASSDGGQRFLDITPTNVGASVSKCVIAPDGTLFVAGSGGFVGVLLDEPEIFADGFDLIQ